MIEPNTETFVTSMTTQAFWKSVHILLTKPHVINKRIWGCNEVFKCIGKPLSNIWYMPVYCKDFIEYNKDVYIAEVIKHFKIRTCDDNSYSANDVLEIVLLELLPKSFTLKHVFQLVCLNKNENMAIFYNVTPDKCSQTICPDFTYSLQLLDNNLIFKSICDNSTKTYKWLVSNFLCRFLKWGEESCEETRNNLCNESLSLVSNEKYYQKYNELKIKYGKEMVKIWPECTDPNKFVYEDVAIATYLLVLWDNELGSKINFVDLGCGNGLLVYILTKEGHTGVGIDVRKRQIWELYSNDVILQERTIIPSDANLFPETDWIIGNHSDELTPWIPVIAARSSYKCNFFLLPCCAYNFDGSKYQRRNSSKSQYTEYLEYIKELCETCGFITNMDRLKIPSTKRICLVGHSRTHGEASYTEYCRNIKNLLQKETNSSTYSEDQSWVKDFKPRESVERVRNCTQVDKSIIESIVDSVTNYLLEGIDIKSDWNPGKTVEIKEIVSLLPHDKLNALKSECGGLQTLLKNNHHIFKIQSGAIQLRYPKTVKEVNQNKTSKNKAKLKIHQKQCWFYNNHPQGCPLDSTDCSFLHTK
ncbi:probable tRNA (uracil-O(2)-)-methyltransferase [Plodia interpunctella]|uniref:probable tRNA (uracil-O(2)-)-methyltransferase n=1 Tax=Plodia interpunctella TaxID=58824 RepID=UPI002367F2A8|nr:probable tRNA (uracil-O(2)-)-methyltransferase [Plodia interpunctella]